MKKLVIGAILITAIIPKSFSQCEETIEPKVLLVGDSWAFFLDLDQSITSTLSKWGHSNFTHYTNPTLAVNGARTDDFLEEARLTEIKNQLESKPSINVVHLSIGGNDILGDWNVDMTTEEEEELADEVFVNMTAIIDFIKAVRPDVHIVWSGYMYPNFEESIEDAAPFQTSHPFYETWSDMGFPNFEQINNVLNTFSVEMAELAATDDRVDFVNVPALMQYHFGQEHTIRGRPGWYIPAFSRR